MNAGVKCRNGGRSSLAQQARPGEYRHLTPEFIAYAPGTGGGGFFTPTGCLAASAGGGAEPLGFSAENGPI